MCDLQWTVSVLAINAIVAGVVLIGGCQMLKEIGE